jgi:hypothetical protein
MLDKFFIWVGRNRKEIGLTVAGLNILGGLSFLSSGNIMGGVAMIALGVGIGIDAVMSV